LTLFCWFPWVRNVLWFFGEPLVRRVIWLKQNVHGGIVVAEIEVCRAKDYVYVVELQWFLLMHLWLQGKNYWLSSYDCDRLVVVVTYVFHMVVMYYIVEFLHLVCLHKMYWGYVNWEWCMNVREEYDLRLIQRLMLWAMMILLLWCSCWESLVFQFQNVWKVNCIENWFQEKYWDGGEGVN